MGAKQVILREYEHLGLSAFADLMTENETECDKLSELLCNDKFAIMHSEHQMMDALNFSDDGDDGGFDPNDFDINLNEIERILNGFNNDILHSFMQSYFEQKLPFKARKAWPIGMIESDITKKRKIAKAQNEKYFFENRRKQKKKLK